MNIKIFRCRDNKEIPKDKYRFYINKVKLSPATIEINIDEDQLEKNKLTGKTEKYRVEFEYEGMGNKEII